MRLGPMTPPAVMCPDFVLILVFRNEEELEQFKAEARSPEGATVHDGEDEPNLSD